MGYVIIEYMALFLAVLLVLPIHEFAHAFAAVKCGDNTPRAAGRYTLNPFAHFDVLGLIMLIVARFGWAKPVPINPYNFKNVRKGYFWTSIAGVLANYLTAFLAYPIFVVLTEYVVFDFLLFDELLKYFLLFAFMISVNLVVFNLFPVYPLDGFRVMESLTQKRGKVFNFLRRYGYFVLLGLIIWSVLAERVSLPIYFDPFGFVMQYLTAWLRFPITAFWSLIL